MKPLSLSSPVLFLLFFYFISFNTYAQIQVTSGVDPIEMVEMMLGYDIVFENVQYTGANHARGNFMEGDSAFLGLNSGIFLTSGAGYVIPGPNDDCNAGVNNNLGGNALLTAMIGVSTFDAADLQFDFMPLTDTLKIKYVFGSEEYNEFVNSTFIDAFAIFISGPNPLGGNYSNNNIATVPNSTNIPISVNTINNGFSSCEVFTSGPCTNCEYYYDNTSGSFLEFDGYTTPLTTQALVIPNEFYHMNIIIADAGDGIFDSGILLNGTCFPDFQSFSFLMQNNPGLTEDVFGTISGDTVLLTVPQGTDVTDLVATFDMMLCTKAFADNTQQFSNSTHLDFTEPVIYTLKGTSEKDWTVIVNILTTVKNPLFSIVKIYPNPSTGKFKISNVYNCKIKVLNYLGSTVTEFQHINQTNLIIENLKSGLYFIKIEKNGFVETRKVVIR